MIKKIGKVTRVASSPAGDNRSVFTKLKLTGFSHTVSAYHLPRINVGENVAIYSEGDSWKQEEDDEGSVQPCQIEILGKGGEVLFTWFRTFVAVNRYMEEK
ncbi:MAG: hypothetical protein WC813_01160 [Patescibacteria group bacterium]|jgi:hypothetical protein